MPGARKLRWVICSQIGTVAAGRASSIGDVVRSILPVDGLNDWEVVALLGHIIASEGLPAEAPTDTEVHVNLSRAWGKKSLRSLSFADVIAVIGPSGFWESSIDDEIESTLTRIIKDPKSDLEPSVSEVLLG